MSIEYVCTPLNAETMNKIAEGERLTDDELLGAARHYCILSEMLLRMGPTWRLAQHAAFAEEIRLSNLVDARGLADVLKEMLKGTLCQVVTEADVDQLVYEGANVANQAGNESLLARAKQTAKDLIQRFGGKARKSSLQFEWQRHPELSGFIVC